MERDLVEDMAHMYTGHWMPDYDIMRVWKILKD